MGAGGSSAVDPPPSQRRAGSAGGNTAAAQPPGQPGTGSRSTSGAASGTAHGARPGGSAGRSERPDLDRDAAERVLRRAIALSERTAGRHDGIDLGSLLAAAEELDLPTEGVHRAFAEEQLGLLDCDERPADRILGPDQVAVARVVRGSPEEVLDRIDGWMRHGRILRRRRRDTGRAVYSRRSDPVAVAQRTIRAARGSERLARVRRLEVAVAAVAADRTLVVLRVDTSASRVTAAVGSAIVATSGVLTSAVVAVEFMPWAWLGVPVAVAGGAGVAVARRAWLADVDEDLESVLDGVASGAAPVSVINTMASHLAASASRVGVRRRPGPTADSP